MSPQDLFQHLHEQPIGAAEATVRRAVGGRPAVCVSACLFGIPCRYDGGAKPLAGLEARIGDRVAVPLCPEVMAGLGIPRLAMAFVGGDGEAALQGHAVLADLEGRDCTPALRIAVQRAVRLARAAGCTEAILKERSPSCGVHQTHARSEGPIPGQGMFAAALRRAGIAVQSDEESPSSP